MPVTPQHPVGVVKALAAKSVDGVIAFFSCGKDSIAVLDLCVRYFKRVEPFFMYLVPGLSFQERYLEYVERRYGLAVRRMPHWQLAGLLRAGTFRPRSNLSASTPPVSIKDVELAMRAQTGLRWVASGQKMCDSIERRGQMSGCGGIDEKTGRVWPLAHWTDKTVYAYLKHHKIPLPPDYKLFGRSFGRLHAGELTAIRDHYPDDYDRILEVFPYAGAEVARAEFARSGAAAGWRAPGA